MTKYTTVITMFKLRLDQESSLQPAFISDVMKVMKKIHLTTNHDVNFLMEIFTCG